MKTTITALLLLVATPAIAQETPWHFSVIVSKTVDGVYTEAVLDGCLQAHDQWMAEAAAIRTARRAVPGADIVATRIDQGCPEEW